MSKLTDLLGTIANTFQIGIGGSGVRTLRFRNGFQGDLTWTPTATRTILLPNTSGTVQLVGDEPIGSPEGLTLSYVTSSVIAIAAGRAVIATAGNRAIAVWGSSGNKNVSSLWSEGTGNGRFTGAAAVGANQTWHVFLIRNTTTGAVDAGFDSSVSGANIPSGWVGRIIGSFMTDSSSNIRNFVQTGDRFEWTAAIQDFNNANTTTTTSNLITLTVPTGLNVIAFGRLAASGAVGNILGGFPGVDADTLFAALAGVWSLNEIQTNTSAQIRFYASAASITGVLWTRGFIHPRGAY